MASRLWIRSLLVTKQSISSVLSRSYTSLSLPVANSSVSTIYNSPLIRLRPLIAISSNLRNLSPFVRAVRGFSTRQTSSSLNDQNPNWSNRPPKETILLDGCDFEHWLVVVEKPDENMTRDEIIDSYVKILASVVGSEEEARMKMYSVSTRHYFAFGALVSEELSYKLKELPNVRWVLPDSYLDVKNKDYGGEPVINGQAVPYDPKYHEEWVRNNARANERNRRNDRPRNFDRSRNYDRRRDNAMQNRGVPNAGPSTGMGGPPGMGPQQNMGGPPGMGPPQNMGGPPGNMGPPQNMGGPPGNMGPPQNMGGQQSMAGPPGNMGPPQDMRGQQSMGGSPGNMGPPPTGGMQHGNMGGVNPNMGGMQNKNYGNMGPPPTGGMYSNLGGVPPNNMATSPNMGGMLTNNYGNMGPPPTGRMQHSNMDGMPPNNMGTAPNMGGMQNNNYRMGGLQPNKATPPNYASNTAQNMGGVPNSMPNAQNWSTPNNGGMPFQSGPGPNTQYQNAYPPNMNDGYPNQSQNMPGRDTPPSP